MINVKICEEKSDIRTFVTLLIMTTINLCGRKRTAVINTRVHYESCSYDSDQPAVEAITAALHSMEENPDQTIWTGEAIDEWNSFYFSELRAEYAPEDINDENVLLLFSAYVIHNDDIARNNIINRLRHIASKHRQENT